MVIINGKAAQACGMSVQEYLDKADISAASAAVMLGGEILPKSEYRTAVLKDGDELEIISFVGGG